MSFIYPALGLLIIAVLTVTVWSRTRWVRTTVAVMLVVVQAFVLGMAFDMRARQVMTVEISRQLAAPDAPRAVRLVLEEQVQDRGAAALVSLALLILAVIPHRLVKLDGSSSRDKPSA